MKDALVKGLLGDAEDLKKYAAKRGGPVLAEMVDEIEPSAEAVTISDGPYRIIRPEGSWHKPGPLERSADRGTV